MPNLEYLPEIHVYGEEGRLEAGGKSYRCVVGKSGVVSANQKKEGDSATPDGSFLFRKVHYRSDRLDEPETGLRTQAMSQDDGWCDDGNDTENYNRLVKLPYRGSHEELWREDDLYNIVVEIGYNDDPPVAGEGSAIFMHIAREAYTPTAGCVALSQPDLLKVLKQIGPKTKIVIHK